MIDRIHHENNNENLLVSGEDILVSFKLSARMASSVQNIMLRMLLESDEESAIKYWGQEEVDKIRFVTGKQLVTWDMFQEWGLGKQFETMRIGGLSSALVSMQRDLLIGFLQKIFLGAFKDLLDGKPMDDQVIVDRIVTMLPVVQKLLNGNDLPITIADAVAHGKEEDLPKELISLLNIEG